jgi:hypothetical protein
MLQHDVPNDSFVPVFRYSKCFYVASCKCSIWMLHIFLKMCCKCIFQMFHLFQTYVAFNVSCCTCFMLFEELGVRESDGGTAWVSGNGAVSR